MLQGSGHCFRALGSHVLAMVQKDTHGDCLGRAHNDEEEATALVPPWRGRRRLPLQADKIDQLA